MKSKSQTQKSKSKNTKHRESLNTSLTQIAKNKNEFEDMILDIDIKKPRSSFTYYIVEMREKHNLKGSATDIASKYSEKYQRLTNTELAKYQKLTEEDKQRYEANMKMVKKFILEKPFKEKATARSLFIEEKLAVAREFSDLTKEELNKEKEKAREEWEDMEKDDKLEYEEKLAEHNKMYEDLKKSTRKTKAYTLYMKDQMAKAKKNEQEIDSKSVVEKWEKCSQETKEKYSRYAEEETEENAKRRHIYEIAYGLKPKMPMGALKFYFNELKSSGKVTLQREAKAKWEKLDDEEQEKYLKMAKKESLAFILKKREYKRLNAEKRIPNTYNLFVADLKGIDPETYKEKGFFGYASDKYQNLSEAEKNKLDHRVKKLKDDLVAKKEAKAEIEEMKPKKKPNTAYNLFIRERVPEIKKKFPNIYQQDVFGKVAQEFKEISPRDLKKLEEKVEEEKEDYEKKMKKYELKLEKFNEKEKPAEDEKSKGKSKSKKKSKGKGKSVRKNSNKSKNADSETDNESDYESEKDKKKKKNKTKETKSRKSRKMVSDTEDSGNETSKSQKSKRSSSRKTKTRGRK